MFDTLLFLGFPLIDSYRQELHHISPSERELFIQSQASPYLQQIENEGMIYLGKFLGASIEVTALESSQSHILSLLKKLVPQFPYEQYSLHLLAVPVPQSSSCVS